jgi:hypothetical protein
VVDDVRPNELLDTVEPAFVLQHLDELPLALSVLLRDRLGQAVAHDRLLLGVSRRIVNLLA